MTASVTPNSPATASRATVINIMQALREVGITDESAGRAPEPIKATKELPDGAQEALDAFVAAKELRAYAEGQKDVYEQIIREMLDGADIGTLKGKEVVRLNKSHNSHFDAAILRDGFPEAYEAAKKRTDYDYLSVR